MKHLHFSIITKIDYTTINFLLQLISGRIKGVKLIISTLFRPERLSYKWNSGVVAIRELMAIESKKETIFSKTIGYN